MRKLVCIAKALVLFHLVVIQSSEPSAASTTCNPPVARDDGWTVGAPSSVGLDEMRLCSIQERLAGISGANMHAILVIRHGQLVFEQYFSGKDEIFGKPLGVVAHNVDLIHDMRSISKDVTSLLFGIALDRKLIESIDEPVFKFFPEYNQLRTVDKDRILLRHLLTMSSGLAWDETTIPYSNPGNSETQMLRSADPYRYVLMQPLQETPGARFVYSGGAPTLLAGVIQKATGKPLLQFAREELFVPLGITDTQWIKVANGEFSADAGLRLRPRDLAKLGQLILQHGQWQGRQIVSAEWIAQSTTPQIEAIDFLLFGYQWWLSRLLVDRREIPWIAAMGLGGQRLFVVPALDLVVVTTAGYYDSLVQYSLPWEIFRQYVVRSIRDGQ
jgi:CubicO group peptidase (beta-lactamase class C family)